MSSLGGLCVCLDGKLICRFRMNVLTFLIKSYTFGSTVLALGETGGASRRSICDASAISLVATFAALAAFLLGRVFRGEGLYSSSLDWISLLTVSNWLEKCLTWALIFFDVSLVRQNFFRLGCWHNFFEWKQLVGSSWTRSRLGDFLVAAFACS